MRKGPLVVPLALVVLLGSCASEAPEDAIPTLDARVPIPSPPAQYGFKAESQDSFQTKIPMTNAQARAFWAYYESSMAALGWKKTDSVTDLYSGRFYDMAAFVSTWARGNGRVRLSLVSMLPADETRPESWFGYTLCPPMGEDHCTIPDWVRSSPQPTPVTPHPLEPHDGTPKAVARTLYEAQLAGDRTAAAPVASDQVVRVLFKMPDDLGGNLAPGANSLGQGPDFCSEGRPIVCYFKNSSVKVFMRQIGPRRYLANSAIYPMGGGRWPTATPSPSTVGSTAEGE